MLLNWLFVSLATTTPWYDQKMEGWYYYQEKDASSEPLTLEEAEEILEEEKENLKRLLSLAVIDPTPENVENYMKRQALWIDQSALFAKRWDKALLKKPSLNNSTSCGRAVQREVESGKKEALFDELSKSRFLLFCFRGKDPLSKPAAETAKQFAAAYSWRMKALSLDGFGIDNLEQFEGDQGLSKKLGVVATPSFFVVDPSNGIVLPVGAGAISLIDLERNVELQETSE